MQSLEMIAKTIASSSFFGRLTWQEVVILFLVARDYNLPRSVILTKGMNMIKGQVELSARLMNMLIRRGGHQIKVTKSDSVSCYIWGKRTDTGEEMEVSFTIEDAKKARIWSADGAWSKYPADMCFARAISRLARRLFPDCIGNCYVEGEIDDKELGEGIEVPQVEYHEAEVEIPLPDDLTKEQVEEYVFYLSDTYKKSPLEIRKAAVEKVESFLDKVREFKKKKEPLAETEATEDRVPESSATDQYQALSDPQ
jgi:hypothetical protein